MQGAERKIIKTGYDSPQSRTRGLAFQIEKDLGLRVYHETIRNVVKNTSILQEWLLKKTLLSAKNVKKRLRFAIDYISLPPGYCDDVIFSDETNFIIITDHTKASDRFRK